jgi:Fe2+ or Zn2+ uptake regulation protein
MTWKWRLELLSLLENDKLKSTKTLLDEGSEKVGVMLNWESIHRTMMKLLDKGLVERFETKNAILWRRKEKKD